MEASTHRVHFLDTWVIKQGPHLITDLYTKPTDSNNLLHHASTHPPHCKGGIPEGQFLRIRRICTQLRDYIRHTILKARHFLERGYPISQITLDLLRVAHMDRDTLLLQQSPPSHVQSTPSNHTSDDQILVTTFHPSFGGLGPIVRANWDILGTSHRTQYLHHSNLVTGLRRLENLKDLLVTARTDYHPTTPALDAAQHITPPQSGGRTYNICSTKNCRYCTRLDTTGRITSKTTGRSYSTKTNVSCKSSNLVYCLECTLCGLQYIGQTERRLMSRICEHFAKITHRKMDTDIGRHFCTPPHTGDLDTRLYILDFIHCNPQSPTAEKLRDQIESNWIHRLKCLAPQGLNLKDTPRYRKKRD